MATGFTPRSRRWFLGTALGAGLALAAPPLHADMPSRERPPRRPPYLGPSSRALLDQAGFSGTAAWMVMDVETGTVLDMHQPGLSLPPASTLKTITALYALDRLGADYHFSTRILREPGRLILEGNGDPVLDSDALAALAIDAAKAVQDPPGKFILAPVWPNPEIPQLDPRQAVHLPYNPTISGLNLNFNRVYLDWRNGANGPVFGLEARGRRHSPRAYTISIGAVNRDAPLFALHEAAKTEEWTVARHAVRQPGSRWLPVRRPAFYAGDVFQTLARAEGLSLPTPELGKAEPDAVEIARHDSPAMAEIVTGMLEYSTNLTAEILGLKASGRQDLRASADAMADWVRENGASGVFSFADHSGLSAGSSVTARMLARLMAASSDQGRFVHHLPETDRITAEGKREKWPGGLRVPAKSGTLNFVSNLTGYIETPGGRQLAFAILAADMDRRRATEGQELPAGVATWTIRARHLQSRLIESWAARFDEV